MLINLTIKHICLRYNTRKQVYGCHPGIMSGFSTAPLPPPCFPLRKVCMFSCFSSFPATFRHPAIGCQIIQPRQAVTTSSMAEYYITKTGFRLDRINQTSLLSIPPALRVSFQSLSSPLLPSFLFSSFSSPCPPGSIFFFPFFYAGLSPGSDQN